MRRNQKDKRLLNASGCDRRVFMCGRSNAGWKKERKKKGQQVRREFSQDARRWSYSSGAEVGPCAGCGSPERSCQSVECWALGASIGMCFHPSVSVVKTQLKSTLIHGKLLPSPVWNVPTFTQLDLQHCNLCKWTRMWHFENTKIDLLVICVSIGCRTIGQTK